MHGLKLEIELGYQSSHVGSFFGQLKLSLNSREFAIVP